MALTDYLLLGRSGLRVSPLSLGTMTFGDDWGWGAEASESRRIFDAYVERGGNFIDTANFYTEGNAEQLLGSFLGDKRERLVLATKYTLNMRPGDPNGGGNHRKNMMQSVEASLRRLGTDYLDLLYLHAWDDTTPVEEIMRGFDDLVRAGKVLYAGISDTPAWQVARMQTIADLRGWAPLVALQVEYSLAERSVEHDLLPMADALGLGVHGWSPLAMGVLTGKYSQADLAEPVDNAPAGTRRNVAAAHNQLNARSLAIADVVKRVATQCGRTPAQVALAWLLQRRAPRVIPIVGARTVQQLEQNLGSLELTLEPAQLQALDDASAIAPGFPHAFLRLPMVRQAIGGGVNILPREHSLPR